MTATAEGRRAFRRFVLAHHPDRGGDHATFVAGLDSLRPRQPPGREPAPANVTFYRRPRGAAAVRHWCRRAGRTLIMRGHR